MGDMNWHAHMGATVPVQVAAEYEISLVWGEHGYTDLSGQFSMNDFPEMSYRDRLEHFGRGYEMELFRRARRSDLRRYEILEVPGWVPNGRRHSWIVSRKLPFGKRTNTQIE